LLRRLFINFRALKAVQAVFNGELFAFFDFFQRDVKILLDTPFRYLIYQISIM